MKRIKRTATDDKYFDGMIIPPCCPGCKHGHNMTCHKKVFGQNYCLAYRIYCFFDKKYGVNHE